MKVCDPQTVAMLPTLGAEIAKSPEFKEVAKLLKGSRENVSTLSLLKSLISSEDFRRP